MTTKSVGKTCKPLETLTIDVNGNPVPALSSYFVESRPMVPFTAPPKPNKNGVFTMGAKDSWFHKMDIYKSNMEWLLALSHHKFWSQIVYGTDTWDSVVSFLQEGYPFYATDGLPEDEEIMAIYYQIFHLIFYVVKRAMTRKESETNFIGKKYGSLLYNYTIISVPMMIDISVLFGERFQRETAEIISGVFTAQPLYEKDLENAVQTVKMALCLVEEKFTGRPAAAGEVTKLTDGVRVAKRLGVQDLQDVVYYLLDISGSLATFLETYKPAAAVFHHHKFELNIASLYENAFPSAVQQVQECYDSDETMSSYFTLMFKLNNARFYFIKLYRLCIEEALKDMFEKPTEGPSSQAYLDIMSDCLSCNVFMRDYHSKFPIDHDLDAIAQNCPDFDNIKYNFLLESLMACFDKPVKQNKAEPPRIPKQKAPPQPVAEEPEVAGNSEVPLQEDIHLKISEVKDFLPHLGDGFIHKCLEHFNMSTSAAINAILEDNLPEEIQKLDHELPFIPPEEDHSSFGKVYGKNEYTEMCKDFEQQYLVHRGKKQARETDLKELLDDKSFRKDCGNRFSQLGIIESLDDVYDDEYDDTYDDSELPVPEVEEPDRKFVVPRVLQQGRRNQEEEDSGEEDGEEESEEQKRQRSYTNFCENPEEVRARYAQKRLANMRHPPAPKKDVVGNAKGQGQDAKVLRNRQQKTVHKSANRKKAAQFKQSKGMF